MELQFGSWPAALGEPGAAALDRAPAPGKWSARENLAHIARMHEITRERVRKILAEEKPEMPPYRAEDDPDWPAWRNRPAAELLEISRRRRAELTSEVRRLSGAELARIGVHGRLGPLTLARWIHFFLLHEAHHLYVILKLVREKTP